MYLRQATATFLKRIRIPPQIINSSLSGETRFSNKFGSRESSWRVNHEGSCLWWSIIAGQAAIFLGMNADPVLADAPNENCPETEPDGTNGIGLRKIEDGSIVSNVHTSKWRIFTDKGKESFLEGKLDVAERFFLSALEEAKKGFGDRDAHVASACNNLAELHRIKKEFDEAEPLYLEAINILEESFGPSDIRVGAALHNLGQFYFIRRKLEEAHKCYERALKIKRRVLGHGHPDCADTMYHLGTVLYLKGYEKDAEDLIQDSIQILEEAGEGESIMCIRRLQYLSQMYMKSNRLAEAENVQRKIMHIMELSKGWSSMDTVIAAERLALTLQAAGNLKEAHEVLERCLAARKMLLSEDHIQIGANILHIARVAMLNANQLRNVSVSEAVAEFDNAKDLLDIAIRIARNVLKKFRNQKGSWQQNLGYEETRREARAALMILLQSLDTLGHLEITKQEFLKSMDELVASSKAESASLQCISAYKEFKSERSISDSPEVKVEYLSCLKRLASLISNDAAEKTILSKKFSSQELNDEIKRVEGEISSNKKSKS